MKKTYPWQGREVPGEEIEFEPEKELFNSYILQDGTSCDSKQ